MASLTRSVVRPVDGLVTGGSAAAADPTGQYDVLIGDVPFMAAYGAKGNFGQATEYRRETAQYRKDQQDQTTEPGEQSLVYWWLRSQSSFHYGAGRVFAEKQGPNDQFAEYQFATAQGVDVWTAGKVTLLPRQVAQTAGVAGSGSGLVGFSTASGPGLLNFSGASLVALTGSGDQLSGAAVTWGGTGSILSVCSDGSNYYAANSTSIYRGALPAGAGAALWNTGNANVVVGWAKQRLMAAIGPSVYELAGGSPPTLPAPKFTHPNANWKWTCFAEGPEAIYAAGYAGEQSAVYKFVLDTGGAVPTLSSGITAVQPPRGELIYSMHPYLGGYLAIGTNRGVRVGLISGNGNGSVVMGAQSVPLPAGSPPVRAITAYDRFLYAGWPNAHADGTSGLVRIDLSALVDPTRFAWSPDAVAHVTGDVWGAAMFGDRPALVAGGQVSVASASLLEQSGSLTTGRIRYHTLEPKLFKFAHPLIAPLVGGVQMSVTDQGGVVSKFPPTVAPAGLSVLPEQQLNLGPNEFVSLTFTLTPTGDGLSGPTLHGYQLKSLPAQKRQRQEVLVLSCYDREKDRNGNATGADGWALKRLLRLEALEEASDAVVLQHLTADPEGVTSRLMVIDGMSFTQVTPPTRTNGWGGVLIVSMRSVT